MKITLLSACLFLSLVPRASADVLRKQSVPEKARWVAHIDVESLARSQLLQSLKEHGLQKEIESAFAEDEDLAGIDPLHDVRSVTVFNSTEDDDHTVIVVRASDKADALLARHQKETNSHMIDFGGRKLHAWGDSEGGKQQVAYFGSINGGSDRMIVVGEDAQSVSEAIDVVEGKCKSLADTDALAFRRGPSDGAILFAAAIEPIAALGENPATSTVARLANAWRLEFGEQRGSLYGDLWLKTGSTEDAAKLQQVLQGATALVGLMAPQVGPRISSILSGLSFQSSGTEVTGTFHCAVADVMELINGLEELGDHDDSGAKPEKHHKGHNKGEKDEK